MKPDCWERPRWPLTIPTIMRKKERVRLIFPSQALEFQSVQLKVSSTFALRNNFDNKLSTLHTLK